MSSIRSIYGSLNVRGLFECRACGVRTLGDSFSVEVEAARPPGSRTAARQHPDTRVLHAAFLGVLRGHL